MDLHRGRAPYRGRADNSTGRARLGRSTVVAAGTGRIAGRSGRTLSGVARRIGPGEREEVLQRILATVDSIPRGRVATYGQVAEEAGLPRRARLVGRTLRELPPRTKLPWHRVVNASGRISARGDGSSGALQRRRLEREGVVFDPSGRIDLRRFRWEA